MSRPGFFFLSLMGLLGALLLSGCSSGKAPTVAGSVSLDGRPLAAARVAFYPKEGGNVAAGISQTNEEGKFVIQPDQAGRTLAPGSYKVLVSKYVQKDGKAPPDQDLDMLLASGTLRNVVPARYGDTAKSPLTCEIKPGVNNLPEFQVSSR